MSGIELAQQLLAMAPFALTLLAAGLVAGGIGGLFGVGGGAVLVPVLYQFFIALDVDESVRMQLAVGTSLGIIVPTSLRSLQSHIRHDAVDIPYLRKMAVWIFLGVFAGSIVASFISGRQLRALFAVLAMFMALKMIFGRSDFRLWDDFPPSPLFQGLATGIGFFSVLMGIGGGVFNNILMTLFGRSIHTAVATSAGIGVLISIPGVAGFVLAGQGQPDLPSYSWGFVNLLGVLLVIPASIFAAPYGARLAHSLSKKALQKSFAFFLMIVALRFFVSLF
jgi:uncharacterized membrane protein YfcA